MILKIKNRDAIHLIKTENVLYCQAYGNYTCFNLREKKVLVYRSLCDVTTILQKYQFFRSHKSYLINLNEVVELFTKRDRVMLSNKTLIPVSKRRRKELEKSLGNL